MIELRTTRLSARKIYLSFSSNWLLSVSALLGVLPFIFYHVSWFSFIFLVPLFLLAQKRSLHFVDGFLWGIIFWAIHLSFLLATMTQRCNVPLIGVVFLWLCIIIYVSCYSGLWFLCARMLYAWSNCLFFSWFMSSWAYFLVIDAAMLFPFDIVEGYELAHPLLPLIVFHKALFLLPYIKKSGLLAFLVCQQIALSFLLFKQNHRFLMTVIFVTCLAFWMVGYILPQKKSAAPNWLEKTICLRLDPFEKKSIWKWAHCMREELAKPNRDQKMLVIMPESTCPFALNEHQEVIAFLHEYSLKEYRNELILGGQRRDHESVYNCLYHISSGEIHSMYDKRHGMFFVERIPRFCDIPALRKIFLSGNEPFCQSSAECKEITSSLITYQPVLCSELFFSRVETVDTNAMLLVLVNDAWFPVRYQQDLMASAARFNAILWQKDILYVSYSNAALYSKEGFIWNIKCA